MRETVWKEDRWIPSKKKQKNGRNNGRHTKGLKPIGFFPLLLLLIFLPFLCHTLSLYPPGFSTHLTCSSFDFFLHPFKRSLKWVLESIQIMSNIGSLTGEEEEGGRKVSISFMTKHILQQNTNLLITYTLLMQQAKVKTSARALRNFLSVLKSLGLRESLEPDKSVFRFCQILKHLLKNYIFR